MCFSPLTILVALLWAHSHVSKTGDNTLDVVSPGSEERVAITATDLLATLLLTEPSMWLFAERARCWLIFNLLSNKSPKYFSAKMLSLQLTSSLHWCIELLCPRCSTLLLPLLKFVVLFSSFLQPVLLSNSLSTALPNLVSSMTLLRVHSVLSLIDTKQGCLAQRGTVVP